MRFKYGLLFILLSMIPSLGSVLYATDQGTLKLALDTVYQDEFDARSRYEGVLNELGSVKPFSNIVVAEGRHMEALEQLYMILNLEKPVLQLFTYSRFSSVAAACAASVEAEIKNIQLYDKFLGVVTEEEVRNVFTRLRNASADRHLPAFRRCQGMQPH